jgi:hypothetical protein
MGIALSLNLMSTSPGRFDRAELGRILKILAEHAAIPAVLSGSVARGGRFKAASPDALADLALDWPDGRLVQLGKPGAVFSGMIDVYEARCAIDLFLSSTYVEAASPDLMADLVRGFEAVASDGSAPWRVREHSGLTVRNFPYPRLRPPRQYPGLGEDALIDLADAREPGSPERAATIEALARKDLPLGAVRSTFGPMVLVDWAAGASLADVEAIRARLSARDAWLAQNAPSEIQQGWNEAGDVQHGLLGGQPSPPLTLYDPLSGVGYKAVHGAAPSGEVTATLRAAGAWRAAGKVENGPEISDLVIITDSRETALALRSRTLEAGLRRVVYAGEATTLWDPFPDGEWIDDR